MKYIFEEKDIIGGNFIYYPYGGVNADTPINNEPTKIKSICMIGWGLVNRTKYYFIAQLNTDGCIINPSKSRTKQELADAINSSGYRPISKVRAAEFLHNQFIERLSRKEKE